MAQRKRPDDIDFELAEHTRIRAAIGDRTLQSANEIPQFRVQKQVLADELLAYREQLKEAEGEIIPSYNDLLIKLVALCLRDFPRLNAWWDESGLKLLKETNVGFAVATEQGVLLPAVRNADEKTLEQIAAETKEMVGLAREGRLRASLQMGAGFTISNIGPTGIDVFDAIISPPQTGILAIGSIMPSAVVVDGEVVVRNTMWLSLTIDHRSVDGADGARFVASLAQMIESAGDLLSQ
jgi:pyruvate dehydrogenase E2 component (dihydrolipoamide acetyltransferase)